MHSLLPISVGEGITFHIPDTWVKEVGEQGEYAFISSDDSVFMTAMFLGLDPGDDTSLPQILEEATAGITEMADTSSPLIEQENYIARHIMLEGQYMLFAMTEGFTNNLRVVANLFFKTQDENAFEKNRVLMDEIISAVEIKA